MRSIIFKCLGIFLRLFGNVNFKRVRYFTYTVYFNLIVIANKVYCVVMSLHSRGTIEIG